MAPPVLHFAVVSDSNEFESLREEWSALHSRLDHPHLFFSFDWCWNAWKLVAERRGYKLRIVTGRLDGRLVLVWPMMEDNRVLRLLSSETLEYRDILFEPSDYASQWVHQAWSYLVSSTQADAFIFQNLRHPAALSQELAKAATADLIGGGWCPVIQLDRFANWDEYAAFLPKSLMSDQRRQWKRIRQALPGLSFQLIDHPDKIRPVMDWISQHKVSWAKARGYKGVWFHAEEKYRFLTTVAESALVDGQLVLATLSDGDTVISAGWGYVCGSEFLFHAFAYDATYATYSPSRLFLERLIQLCFERNLRTLDFMPGEEPYKRIWATDYVKTESYTGPLSLRGRWIFRLARWKPGGSGAAVLIKRLYRVLPSQIRNVVQRRLREFQLVHNALSLKLIRDPPQESEESDKFP